MVTTQALGISQPDIILRTAIMAGLADLRKNPWLLDYVFASLPADELTNKEYGEKSVAAAKDWFLRTKIPCVMVPRLNEAQIPCISIKLVDSQESEVTLGDIHYVPREDSELEWPALAGPFTPTSYDPQTGTMTVPASVTDVLVLAPGQVVVDAIGGQHAITEVLEDNQFTIEPSTADFSGAVIKGAGPSQVASLESVEYRETFQIGVHVSGEPVYLTWLHSIIVFVLLKYKQEFLEARGLERTVANSTDFDRNENFESEFVFSRYVNLTGYMRMYWPSSVGPKFTSIVPAAIKLIDGGHLPSGVDPVTQLWVGDEDLADD